jgi:hypothetical protein
MPAANARTCDRSRIREKGSDVLVTWLMLP